MDAVGREGICRSALMKQTQSFLIERFAQAGIRPRTELGQNFLIDQNLLRVLVEAARLEPDDVVLEVGTGTGGLTALVAPKVAAVVTVEIDPHLFHLAQEHLAQFTNVTMLQIDALQSKNRLNPQMLAAVAEQLARSPQRRLKLVSNLPYHVATPVLTNLLALHAPPQQMTVTIQKELADRVVARPGSKDYGALSVWIQSQCRAEILRVLPPDVFWPRPKVDSAFLQITLDPQLRQRLTDRDFFHEFVRSIFCHRRKFLRSELASAFKKQLDKQQIDRLLAQLEIEPSVRAEDLPVETLILLSEAVRQALGG